MNFTEALQIALRSLRSNRLRSALTTLGIVIGVSAVIVLVGLGDGMKTGFNKSFGALGTTIIVAKSQGAVPGGGAARDLKDGDISALSNPNQAPDIASVTPVAQGTGLINYNQAQFRADVTGSTADYLTVNNRDIVTGANFTTQQEKSNARVVLLGPNAVTNLFGGDNESAVGKTVRIGRSNFKVLGVLKSDGSNDNIAYMPLDTARSFLLGGGDNITQMVVKAASADQVGAAVEEINKVMDQRHLIKDPGKRDFNVTALGNLLDQANQFLTFLTLFTVAVAGISLIVGAIGVANIMLVSVTERTREIGIRKAIGARRSAIMKQFLIESTMLAGLGGLMGIIIGVGVTVAAAIILPQAVPNFSPPEVSPWAIIIAFGVSLLIGVVAGGYPARRASRLQPIEALRYQ
ncbi:ABC transporter permease [Pseudonocardia spinosispora]|uniref:ABC transporter permease n=1 Tax=Pseudonocardia spinosispora TaxID=103441 RepID=UPI0004196ACD|nr:ABC transporter permease [Pseudonocardia spinosispora]